MDQGQIPVVLFVDQKIQLPENLNHMFEKCKERKGNCDGLNVDIRRYSSLEEIDLPGDSIWLLAAHGNGFRMTKTRRFTPASFRPITSTSSVFKNVVVVDTAINKNPEGMITNVFAWLVKSSTNGVDEQPFYGSLKKPKVQIPYKRVKKVHDFDGGW